MQDRIQAELALLREPYPNMEYQAEGRWFLIPAYSLPKGWNRETTDIAFQVDESYPCAHPYGFFVRSGILFQGATPGNYQDTVPNQPPFEGPWGLFSWYPSNGWFASADIHRGANLLQWVDSFRERFAGGG